MHAYYLFYMCRLIAWKFLLLGCKSIFFLRMFFEIFLIELLTLYRRRHRQPQLFPFFAVIGRQKYQAASARCIVTAGASLYKKARGRAKKIASIPGPITTTTAANSSRPPTTAANSPKELLSHGWRLHPPNPYEFGQKNPCSFQCKSQFSNEQRNEILS